MLLPIDSAAEEKRAKTFFIEFRPQEEGNRKQETGSGGDGATDGGGEGEPTWKRLAVSSSSSWPSWSLTLDNLSHSSSFNSRSLHTHTHTKQHKTGKTTAE